MDRRLFFSLCLIMFCGCNESVPFQGNWGSCSVSEPPMCVSNTSYVSCVDGERHEVSCSQNEICQKGHCVVPGSCQPTDAPYCENNTLVTCEDGNIRRTNCENGCNNNACVEPGPSFCDDHQDGEASCDGNTLIECENGSEKRTNCENGCAGNACVQPGEAYCGNQIIDGTDVCDGPDLGSLTCYDLPDSDPRATYTGHPICKDNCSGIENGTCARTQCGNGIIQPELGEKCDMVDGEAIFLDSPVCSDYQPSGNWKPGGKPGCSIDCKALSRGTCRLVEQPMGNIQECQLVSLNVDEANKKVTVQGKILSDSGIDPDLITGEMRCISHEHAADTLPYAWGLKEKTTKKSCADCDENEFLLSGSMDYSLWSSGLYDCIFVANAQGGANSYYMCGTTMGYPVPLEHGVPDETQRYQFEVPPSSVDGALLSQWEFSEYVKNDTAQSVKAEKGVYAAASIMKISDGSTIRMLSGASGYPDAAASMDRLSQNVTYDETGKHFNFVTSSTGYKNVRIQFKVAGSGQYQKRITVGYKVGDLIATADYELKFNDVNQYHLFPETVLTGADNMSNLEIRIYPYGGSEDLNATIRIDDVYVTGEKMP